MSPSRNAPCPCGSRKKYKYCHGSDKVKHLSPLKDAYLQEIISDAQKKFEVQKEKEVIIRKAKKNFQKKERQGKEFQEKYGLARKPIFVKAKDTTYVAVGNQVYRQTRPGPYNFVTAIHDYGLSFFGVHYLEEQEAKPLLDRHPAMQWLHVAVEEHNKTIKNSSATSKDFSTGAWAAWGRLAYDLYTVKDNADIEKRMQKRLLDEKGFQGARHELAVISLFVTAGFEIKFEDEQDNTRTHSEFIAKHKVTGAEVAVEAKSRHRYGVKGFGGGRQIAPGEKVSVRDLVLDAYKKKQTLPFYVLVDVNLPPGEEEDSRRWLQEIYDDMMNLVAEGYGDPCIANAVFFMNDPSHYMLTDRTVGSKGDLWIKDYIAENPISPHPSIDMAKLILDAYRQRASPPEEIPQ